MTLLDFDSKRIDAQKIKQVEDNKIFNYLAKLTAIEIMMNLRDNFGHPKPKWGDKESWRFYYLEECCRRGQKLFNELKWPTDDNSEYVNIHTGCVSALKDMGNPFIFSPKNISDQYREPPWSILEHWEPFDKRKINKYKIAYLKKKLTS